MIMMMKKGVIEDVRSMTGPDINSDHFLIKAVINKKLSAIHKKIETSTKME